MGAVPNTLRKAGVYYFRRAVPKDLERLLARKELCRSLRTRDACVANSRSRHLYLFSEEMFAVARSTPMLTDADISRLVQDFYATELAEENAIRLNSRVVFDEANRQAILAYYDKLGARSRDALARNDLEVVTGFTDGLLERHGLAGHVEPSDISRLQQAVLRASCELAEAFKARFEGDFTYQPRDPLLNAELGTLATNGSLAAPAEQTSKAESVNSPKFSERAAEFRKRQQRLSVWDNQTAVQARATYQLFIDICTDRPISGYVKADAVRFKDVISELPANYSKAPQYRNMRPSEIVAAVADKEVPRLSSRTVQRHLAALSTLWKSAIEQGEVGENLFSGFKLPTSRKPQDQRAMWSSDMLQKLFDSPIWRGCKSDARRTKPGDCIIRDEKFWLPLIAVFSGMRQEEMCQLHLADIREESGIWVFDVNDKPPRKLKNRNAVRLVPMHRTLIDLGFLDYVEEQRERGEERLFPLLERGGADGRLGHAFAKWFKRYRTDVGIGQPDLVFHSFRHSATTFMSWAGVDVRIIDNLTGHATPGETARYTKSFRVEQLKEAIDSIDPGVDLRHLLKGGRQGEAS